MRGQLLEKTSLFEVGLLYLEKLLITQETRTYYLIRISQLRANNPSASVSCAMIETDTHVLITCLEMGNDLVRLVRPERNVHVFRFMQTTILFQNDFTYASLEVLFSFKTSQFDQPWEIKTDRQGMKLSLFKDM